MIWSSLSFLSGILSLALSLSLDYFLAPLHFIKFRAFSLSVSLSLSFSLPLSLSLYSSLSSLTHRYNNTTEGGFLQLEVRTNENKKTELNRKIPFRQFLTIVRASLVEKNPQVKKKKFFCKNFDCHGQQQKFLLMR